MFIKSKEELQNKYGIKDKGNWLNLKQGSNKIRIVSNFVDYGIHTVKEGGKFKSVICIGKENGCPYCAQGLKVKVQFLGWVIDRTDNKVKLLRIGWTVTDKIRKLQESEEYGFEHLPDYDMDIIKTGEGLDTEYDVIPARKNTELTDEEKDEIMQTVKDPQEIINRMKEKALVTADEPKIEPSLQEENNFEEEEIPF